MKWHVAGTILVTIGLAACQPAKPDSPGGADPATIAVPLGDAAAVTAPKYNLGDVDVATVPTVYLSERSRAQTIAYEEWKSIRGDISVANATVRPPLPDELWVTTSIESPYGYRASDSILVRIDITLDTQKDPILTKNYVWSGDAVKKRPEIFEIDIMPFLNPLPKSVLVLAQVKIVWFPDTDPATITPETADESKGQTQLKESNAFRINFE